MSISKDWGLIMQGIGYLQISNETLLVLIRSKKYGRALKIRQTGSKGIYLKDESEYLALPESSQLLYDLRSGKSILL